MDGQPAPPRFAPVMAPMMPMSPLPFGMEYGHGGAAGHLGAAHELQTRLAQIMGARPRAAARSLPAAGLCMGGSCMLHHACNSAWTSTCPGGALCACLAHAGGACSLSTTKCCMWSTEAFHRKVARSAWQGTRAVLGDKKHTGTYHAMCARAAEWEEVRERLRPMYPGADAADGAAPVAGVGPWAGRPPAAAPAARRAPSGRAAAQ